MRKLNWRLAANLAASPRVAGITRRFRACVGLQEQAQHRSAAAYRYYSCTGTFSRSLPLFFSIKEFISTIGKLASGFCGPVQ